MPYVRNNKYRDIPFSTESRHNDLYIYYNVKDLIIECKTNKDQIKRCRTIGIIQSQCMEFYVTDMDSTGVRNEDKIQLSLVYFKKSLPSTVVPYPVQVFGTVQWKSKPVLYVKIIQVLPVPTAIRIRDIMSLINKNHLANTPPPQESTELQQSPDQQQKSTYRLQESTDQQRTSIDQ